MLAAARAGQFGIVSQRYRVAAGLSQEQLAQRAGVSRRGIADLERGARHVPHPSTVRQLADALALMDGDRSGLFTAARGRSRASQRSRSARLLPVQTTRLLGRDDQPADLSSKLSEIGLLTLSGPGGIGKTRLAVALASLIEAEFADGAWMVDLASVQDVDGVAGAVSRALGFDEHPGQPAVQRLRDSLRGREVLLILDNCEHLLSACAELVENVLRACARVRFVSTSRQPLGLRTETIWRVPSLSGPESVQLFVDRAQSALPSFALTPQNNVAVTEICRRVDGIPLAIELAIPWLAVLSPDHLATRLDDQLRLLVYAERGTPSRQQTLRATLDWTYGLLADAERILLRRLAVFAGGWTITAAEEITSDERLGREDVLHSAWTQTSCATAQRRARSLGRVLAKPCSSEHGPPANVWRSKRRLIAR